MARPFVKFICVFHLHGRDMIKSGSNNPLYRDLIGRIMLEDL